MKLLRHLHRAAFEQCAVEVIKPHAGVPAKEQIQIGGGASGEAETKLQCRPALGNEQMASVGPSERPR